MPHVDVSVRPDLRGSCYYYFNIFPILIKQDCVCRADFSLFLEVQMCVREVKKSRRQAAHSNGIKLKVLHVRVLLWIMIA